MITYIYRDGKKVELEPTESVLLAFRQEQDEPVKLMLPAGLEPRVAHLARCALCPGGEVVHG